MTGLRYKLENWYVVLDIEDTYIVAKRIQWSILLLSYYKMNFQPKLVQKTGMLKALISKRHNKKSIFRYGAHILAGQILRIFCYRI